MSEQALCKKCNRVLTGEVDDDGRPIADTSDSGTQCGADVTYDANGDAVFGWHEAGRLLHGNDEPCVCGTGFTCLSDDHSEPVPAS